MNLIRHKEATFLTMCLTAIWYLTAFSWPMNFDYSLLRAIQSYLFALLLAFIPYLLYLKSLKINQDVAFVKWITLIVMIIVQVNFFASVRFNQLREGWEYVIIPFIQIVIVLMLSIVLIASKRLCKH